MDQSRIIELLTRWVRRAAAEDGMEWLSERREEIAGDAPRRVFYTSFSAVPRYLGRSNLKLSPADHEAATNARPGWQPASWSADQAGRALIVLSLPAENRDAYLGTLSRVFDHADVGESVALYQALPLLPYQEAHRAQAAEGVRSSMTAVFNAVALRNPYPAEQFENPAWNQMVLKAVFEGSSLCLVAGLDERANAELARMLVDYAHERWSAGRSVTPDLWRPVGPFAEGAMLGDLERALREGESAEGKAVALALDQSPDWRASALLDAAPELRRAIEEHTLTWDRFCKEQLEPAP